MHGRSALIAASFLAFPGTGSYRRICRALFWKRFGKEPSLGFPMDLTNLHALLNAQKALWQRIDFASTRIQAAKYPSLLPYRRIGVLVVRNDYLSKRLVAAQYDVAAMLSLDLKARFAES